MTSDKEPDILTVAEAARKLRISRAFAYEMVDAGDLPAIRFGRRIVIPLAAIEQIKQEALASWRTRQRPKP